jgi:hypothetical protein
MRLAIVLCYGASALGLLGLGCDGSILGSSGSAPNGPPLASGRAGGGAATGVNDPGRPMTTCAPKIPSSSTSRCDISPQPAPHPGKSGSSA